MADEKVWNERYQNKEIPWDTGRPDSQLVRLILGKPVFPCKILDMGCGTGTNAIWLARNHFTVTGVDISEAAIQQAREKSSEAGVRCEFFAADCLTADISGAPFDFVFDRGCFHSFHTDAERRQLARNIADHLAENGLWLSLLGSTDNPPRDKGPPQRSAADIVTAVEPFFEILSLTASYFDSNHPNPPRSWVCLMRKR